MQKCVTKCVTKITILIIIFVTTVTKYFAIKRHHTTDVDPRIRSNRSFSKNQHLQGFLAYMQKCVTKCVTKITILIIVIVTAITHLTKAAKTHYTR